MLETDAIIRIAVQKCGTFFDMWMPIGISCSYLIVINSGRISSVEGCKQGRISLKTLCVDRRKRSTKSQDIEELSAFSDDTIGMCDNGKLFSGIFRRKCWKIFLFFLIRILPGMTALIPSAQDPEKRSARNYRNSHTGRDADRWTGNHSFGFHAENSPKRADPEAIAT